MPQSAGARDTLAHIDVLNVEYAIGRNLVNQPRAEFGDEVRRARHRHVAHARPGGHQPRIAKSIRLSHDCSMLQACFASASGFVAHEV